MKNSQCLKWSALVAVPLLILIELSLCGCRPQAAERDGQIAAPTQQRPQTRAQAATHRLLAEVEDLDRAPRLSVVQQFIAQGADVNMRSRVYNSPTPILCVIRSVGPGASQREQIALVRLLLDHGANVNTATDNGYTPLTEAAIAIEPELVRMLLHRGAASSINRPSRSGTALQSARIILRATRQSSPRTLQERHNRALQVRDLNHIIAMLKAAGAHE